MATRIVIETVDKKLAKNGDAYLLVRTADPDIVYSCYEESCFDTIMSSKEIDAEVRQTVKGKNVYRNIIACTSMAPGSPGPRPSGGGNGGGYGGGGGYNNVPYPAPRDISIVRQNCNNRGCDIVISMIENGAIPPDVANSPDKLAEWACRTSLKIAKFFEAAVLKDDKAEAKPEPAPAPAAAAVEPPIPDDGDDIPF